MKSLAKEKRFCADLQEGDYVFLSDSQCLEDIKDYVGSKAYGYASFFVRVEDGDYQEVWGCYRMVPYLDERVYRIV